MFFDAVQRTMPLLAARESSTRPEDLPKTQSVMTMVGGRIVHDAKVVATR